MGRLEEIKDEVARDHGYLNWDNLSYLVSRFNHRKYEREFIERYAKECVIASLDKASENVKLGITFGYMNEEPKTHITKTNLFIFREGFNAVATKESITSQENIILL